MEVDEYVNTPQQGRSLRSQMRILDATSQLLGEAAFDDIAVAQICARAKLSTGAFYARFTSKKAVLYAIQRRYMAGLRADIGRVMDDGGVQKYPLVEVARTVFLLIATRGLAARGVMHAVTAESTRDKQVMKNIAEFSTDLAKAFAAIGDERCEAADMAFATRACIAALQQEWLYPERVSGDELEVLADRLARLLVGYLQRGCLKPGEA